MQTARKAVENFKETAANIGVSAMSGLEKTKAIIQEKSEMMNAQDESEKDMAIQKKQEKINQVEREKQQALEYYASAKQAAVADIEAAAAGTAKKTTGPITETATTNTITVGIDNDKYSNTKPGPETAIATYSATGPGHDNYMPTSTEPGPGTATFTSSGPEFETVTNTTGRPGPETATATYTLIGPGHENAIPTSTGPEHDNTISTSTESGSRLGPETASYTPGNHGQAGVNHTTSMPRHGPGPGHGSGLGELTQDVTAQTTHGGGSAPSSGPEPTFS